MVIPHQSLSPKALRGVIEEYVSREGTDYGDQAYDLESKVSSVLQQLAEGDAVVVFDPETASVSVVAAQDLSEG